MSCVHAQRFHRSRGKGMCSDTQTHWPKDSQRKTWCTLLFLNLSLTHKQILPSFHMATNSLSFLYLLMQSNMTVHTEITHTFVPLLSLPKSPSLTDSHISPFLTKLRTETHTLFHHTYNLAHMNHPLSNRAHTITPMLSCFPCSLSDKHHFSSQGGPI